MVWAARSSTAEILQLLIESGGHVNAGRYGPAPIASLLKHKKGDMAARLKVLLARPELDLNAEWNGETAEELAEDGGLGDLAAAIAAEVGSRTVANVFPCPVRLARLLTVPAHTQALPPSV